MFDVSAECRPLYRPTIGRYLGRYVDPASSPVVPASFIVTSPVKLVGRQGRLAINGKSKMAEPGVTCDHTLPPLYSDAVKEGMIHLLVGSYVKKPDSGVFSDWSRNNAYETLHSYWLSYLNLISGQKVGLARRKQGRRQSEILARTSFPLRQLKP